jgi:hypothetical protein
MRKTVFVPLTDDFLYEHPELIPGPVIPFTDQVRQAIIIPVEPNSRTLIYDKNKKFQITD